MKWMEALLFTAVGESVSRLLRCLDVVIDLPRLPTSFGRIHIDSYRYLMERNTRYRRGYDARDHSRRVLTQIQRMSAGAA